MDTMQQNIYGPMLGLATYILQMANLMVNSIYIYGEIDTT